MASLGEFKSSDGKKMLSTRKAASRLDCAPDYVSKLCREGKLKGQRIDQAWFVELESIEAFEAERELRAASRSEELSQLRKEELTRNGFLPKAAAASGAAWLPFAKAAAASVAIGMLVVGSVNAVEKGVVRGAPVAASVAQIQSPFFGAQLPVRMSGGSISSWLVSLFAKPTVAVTESASTETPVQVPATTTESSSPSPARPTTIVQNTYPVIERTIQTVVASKGVSESTLSERLTELTNELTAKIYQISSQTTGNAIVSYAPSQAINQLHGTHLYNVTVSGISGLSASDIPTLDYFPATTSIETAYGGTGITSYAPGDLLYGNSDGSLSVLPIGSNGKVLKVTGGALTWGTVVSGGGGGGAWATTTDDLAVYPADPSQVVIIGSDATTTTGNILEVAGNSLFSGGVSIVGLASTSNLLVTGSTTLQNVAVQNSTTTNSTSTNAYASSLIAGNATSTNFFATTASSTNLFAQAAQVGSLAIGNLSGFLKATAGAISTSLVSLASDVTGVLGISNGGTGTSTAPTYGQLLVGDGAGGYALVSTSTLGITAGTTYAFPLAGNATSTLTQFNGGLTAYASTTIGNGTQTGGLTINGGATTTGNSYFGGSINAVGAASITDGLSSLSVSNSGGVSLQQNGHELFLGNDSHLNFTGAVTASILPYASSTALTADALFATNLLTTGSTTLQNVTAQNSTTTNATTTNFFATTASSTNLFAQAAQVGSLAIGNLSGFLKATAGTVSTALVNLASDVTGVLGISNGGTGTSTAPTYGQLLVGNSSGGYDLVATSTLGITAGTSYPFSGIGNSTSTLTQFNAGLTAFASSTIGNGTAAGGLTVSGTATSSALAVSGSATVGTFFGANLSTCNSSTQKLLWASGSFSCGTDLNTGSGGGTDVNWIYFNGSGLQLATTTNQVLIGAASTSTLSALEVVGGASFDNSTTTNSTSTNAYASSLIAGNATSTNFFATTASSTNLFAQAAQVGSLAIGNLSGFLKATAGAISTSLVSLASDVTGVLGISNGGTGTSTAPTYGQLLVGNSSGGYDLAATSTLGLPTYGGLSGTYPVVYNGTGNFSLAFGTTTSNTWAGTQTFTNPIAVGSGSGTSTFNGNIGITGNIVPSANDTYSLGSPSFYWKDVYIGPGSLFVNGQEVVHTNGADDVVVSADPNQNIQVKSQGVGAIQLNPSGTGNVQLMGPLSVTAGKQITTTDSSALPIPSGVAAGNITIAGNSISATNLNGGISITPAGNGGTYVTAGNFGVGTTSPFAKLSVVGDTYLAGNVTATGTLAVTGQTTLGNVTATTATTTGLAVTGVTSSLLKTNSLGQVVAAILGTDYQNFAYPFFGTGNSTSTLTQFNGGLTSYASTTIGNGTQAGGLTINGGATTTGNASVGGTLAVTGNVTLSGTGNAVGTITSGIWNGTAIATQYGGLGGNFSASTGALSISGGTVSAGTLSIANGGTNATSQTTNGVTYFDGTKITSGSGLVFSSGNLGVGTTSPFTKLSVAGDAYLGGNVTATGTLAVSGATTLSTLLATGSTTLQNFTGVNATTTSATSTNFFASVASSTNLSAQVAQAGSLTIGNLSGFLKATAGAVSTALVNLTSDVTGILPIANGGTNASSQTSNGVNFFDGTKITSGSTFTFDGTTLSTNQFLATGSSTLQNFTALNSTTTNATSTTLAVSGAGTFGTIYGASLSTCNGSADKLLWSGGSFSCGVDGGGTGGGDSSWTFFNNSGIRLATTTNQVLIGASSTTTNAALEVAGSIEQYAVSDPTLASATTTSGLAYQSVTVGNYTYSVEYGAGLRIIDSRNPKSLTTVGSYTGINTATAVAVAGKYAYVADVTTGLNIIDVSNPANPVRVGNNAFAGVSSPFYYGIAISGKYAYLPDYNNLAVRIVDISDPTSPRWVSSYTGTLGGPYSIKVQGKYAYIADQGGKVHIVDVSNASTPSTVGSYTGSAPTGIYVSGKYAYVADLSSGFYILNIGNPASPSLVGSYNPGGSNAYYGLTVAGNYAYVADHTNLKALVIDISDPANPSLVGSYTAPNGAPMNVAVAGKYAYVSDYDGGLKVLDINGLSSPAASIGSLAADQAAIADSLAVGGDITAGGGIEAGIGGIFSRGAISAYVASSTESNPIVATFMGGRVGIGTTTPASALSIFGGSSSINIGGNYGSGYNGIWLNGLSDASSYNILSGNGDQNLYFNRPSGSDIFFNEGDASNQLVLKTGGNLGLGTTSPYAKFSIDTRSLGASPAFAVGSSTATRFLINNAGNVGIGTSSPYAKLSIATAASDPFNQTLFAISSSTSAFATSTLFSVDNQGDTYTKGVLEFGSIGQGTTPYFTLAPGGLSSADTNGLFLSKFTAVGSPSLVPDKSHSSSGLGSDGNGSVSVFASSNAFDFSPPEVARFTAGGKVGVGTTSPFATLSVVATTSGTLIGGDTASGFSGKLIDLKVASSSLFTVDQTGLANATSLNLASTGSLQQGSVRILYASSTTGSLQLGSGAGNTSNVSAQYNTLVGYNAGANITSGANNTLIGAWSTGSNSNITTGSNNIVIGNNIRVPVATDNNQLNIGNILYGTNINGSVNTPSVGQVGIGTTTPYARFSIHANAGDTNTTLFAIASSTAAATTTLLTVNNNGNVGIGTTTPSYKLDVTGQNAARFSNAGQVSVSIDGTAGHERQLDFFTNNSLRWVAGADAGAESGSNAGSNFFIRGTNDSGGFLGNYFTITRSNGNVGIGTSTPAEKLTVHGNVMLDINNAGYYFTNTSGVEDGAVRLNTSNELQLESGIGGAIRFFNNNATNENFTILGGGNVGVGSTSPFAQLSVNAAAGATPFAVGSSTKTLFSIDSTGITNVGDTQGTGDASEQFASDNNAWTAGYYSGDKSFRIASSTNLSQNVYFSLQKNGNLGIGTTTPYATLSVAGSLALTGPLYDSTASSGTAGWVLQSTGSGVEWAAPSLSVKSVALTSYYGNQTYFVTTQGQLFVAGTDTSNGNLGLGSLATNYLAQPTPINFPSGKLVSSVAALANGGVAVMTDGTVYSWGYNGHGELGNGNTTNQFVPVQVSGVSDAVKVVTTNNEGYPAYSTADTVCVVTSTGALYCWGYNGYGQVGNGTTVSTSTPQQIFSSGIADAVLAGGQYGTACAITTGGALYCWGQNAYGQVGNGNTTNQSSPVAISGVGTVTKVSFGSYSNTTHTCAINTSGALYCWGYNGQGQLGIGNTTATGTPQQIFSSGAVDVFPSTYETYAIMSTSTTRALYSWGYNAYGQLGIGNTTQQTSPVQSSLSGVSKIESAMGYSTGSRIIACAITTSGLTYCWGDNNVGQLGIGNTTQQTSPALVSGVNNATDIFMAGEQNATTYAITTCAIESAGTVKCWGDNTLHEMGRSDLVTVFQTPVNIPIIGNGVAGNVNLWSTSGTSAFRLGGNVGIGTTTPRSTLTVAGSGCFSGVGTTLCGTTAGNIYYNTANTGNYDIAENYVTSDIATGTPGTIMALDPLRPKQVTVATTSGNILGVVSSHPGVVLGGADALSTTTNVLPIALAGRVPVRVSFENGAIEAGDRLALSSTTPGVAVKMVESGQSVGIALENATSSANLIEVFVDPQFMEITQTLSSAQLAAAYFSNTSAALQQGIVELGVNAVNLLKDAVFAAVGVFQKLYAGEVHTDTVCVSDTDGETCITRTQLDALLASAGVAAATSTNATSSVPVLEVNGATTTTIAVGQTYLDLGATITGPTDADRNLGIQASVDDATSTAMNEITIDTSTAATYTILYFATNQNGETGYATRTVIVEDSSQPAEETSTSTPENDNSNVTDTGSVEGSNATSTDTTEDTNTTSTDTTIDPTEATSTPPALIDDSSATTTDITTDTATSTATTTTP